MAATPKRSVHWNFDDISFSELNSPSGSSESFVSTSSLEYANSQLLAHGYVERPGLCLDGSSNKDQERVVKCLLKLLGDRMTDMARTEELTTKLRTLSYEHERLSSMHRSAVDKAANAEREANLHKSKLLNRATQRTLQSSETAHKQTTAELQRTRTSLQAIRSTHQAELKKREKEVERLSERWQKIADLQTKVQNNASGIQCANVAAVEGRSGLDRGPSFLDVALEEAEKARAALLEDNNYLKALFLKAVNAMQRINYQTNNLLNPTNAVAEPTPFTVTTLFPMAPPTYPSDKLSSLLTGLRNSLETVSERLVNPLPASESPESKEAQNTRAMNSEIRKLQSIIESLQNELDRCHNQLEGQAQEIQTMFETFAEQQRNSAKDAADISVELVDSPLRDEEKERLERLREGLDQERQKFTEAAAKFGRDKAALEAERMKFMDEKRSWEMEKMIPERSPTPPLRPASPARHKIHKQSPRKSGFKSPKKALPKKPSSRPKASRGTHTSLGSPKKVIPAGETEILPPLPSLAFSRLGEMPSANSLLSTAFVLPPPSPHASLPSQPALPPPVMTMPPPNFGVCDFDLGPLPEQAEPSSTTPVDEPSTPPSTRKPFPVAKPFALRMVHAYSPAKPSPLSRILMLADTPAGGAPTLPAPNLTDGLSLSPDGIPSGMAFLQQPQMSLAAELGVSESPPDTPLQETQVPNVVSKPASGGSGAFKARVLFPETKAKPSTTTMSAREKGKMRAAEATRAGSSGVGHGVRTARTGAGKEKENTDGTTAGKTTVAPLNVGLRSGRVSPVFRPPPPAGSATGTRKGPSPTSSTAVPGVTAGAGRPSSAGAKPVKPPSSRGAGSSAAAKVPLPAARGGGPRRVPVDSAEAAPVKSRRG
ncbi:Afadin and alpha-actinin-binding-domain-containing protein [Ephemerocybe angulata]|uniref:Afadin and alpha-actinin-binding-domain-containing protein n=1 Tax=Ephemerocybe angulata TaxID=980116 RepID=A0A8H6ME67_9AGAR|nr:Afadin and alpha-actinin-binding-domain-containing protein [Tulosesus angulatus]